MTDVSCALRSKAEVGPSARTREGGTAQTLAGSVRCDETHYTRSREIALAKLGSGDEAAELFHMLNPINHTRTMADVARYKTEPYVLAGDDSDVIRRRKETQRHRRLEPDEEEQLLRSADPHLQAVIIAALETCCREGVLRSLRWGNVSLERGEIILRAENTKDRENRILPISSRLRNGLDAAQ